MRRTTSALLLGALLLTAAGCISVGPMLTGKMETVVVRESPRWLEFNRIALVEVEGVIGSGGGLLRGGTTAADVREKLKRAARDGGVRAVVLRINSPGGEVGASDTIYREVLRFRRETGKPVVACLMDTAASGAYYVACAADRIVASPNAVTGSVGVVIQLLNVEGLFGKLGLRTITIKTGQMKDIGSPTRPMTDKEREVLAGIAEGHFERFLRVVREARPEMTDPDAATISDARVLTAQQALDLHMVDGVAYLEEAIADARKLAGIETADVILYRPFPDYRSNIYARREAGDELLMEGLDMLLRGSKPTFLYLWCPTR